ncbi:MAG: hypothetical protein ACI8ZB_004791 [Desulforhopalus sp.]|jgi:hypothetical protein
MIRFITILCTLVLLCACDSNEATNPKYGKCIACHTMEVDKNHDIKCTSCHSGIDIAKKKDRAHQGLIAHPAHPSQMIKACQPCHEDIVNTAPLTIHFTLSNSTNMFRKAFGATTELQSFTDTPSIQDPTDILELGDDLLRRRCFKCHIYDSGQPYPATSHGQGCAACHLSSSDSEQENHIFDSPTDKQCLSCHYGNYVGFDYYGRFEHDFNVEYRTPYTTKHDSFRTYGVEYHQLSADIHQQKGLSCIDCHTGNELMRSGNKPTCAGCHDAKDLAAQLPERVSKKDNGYILRAQSGMDHPIPTLTHPAHFTNSDSISCQACHAQWSFDDRGKHFLRMDTDEIDSFSGLSVQGNYEIETLLTNNLDYDKDELPIAMTDSLKGLPSIGIWLKGYVTRRWENVTLGRDTDGRITVVRPILDYSLSWMDEDETVQFDAVPSQVDHGGLRPYTPHTTGSAGLFYQARIHQFLNQEKQMQNHQPDNQAQPNQ